MRVHFDGVKVTGRFAITVTETAPETRLSTAGDQGGRGARVDAFVMGTTAGDVVAPGTCQAGNLAVVLSDIDTQQLGDLLVLFRCSDGAAGWNRLARNQRFGKSAAPGMPAAATIGVRQQLLDVVDAGILFHSQESIGNDENGCQNNGQTTDQNDCEQESHHGSDCNAIGVPFERTRKLAASRSYIVQPQSSVGNNANAGSHRLG
jgi:hypothetical protein